MGASLKITPMDFLREQSLKALVLSRLAVSVTQSRTGTGFLEAIQDDQCESTSWLQMLTTGGLLLDMRVPQTHRIVLVENGEKKQTYSRCLKGTLGLFTLIRRQR